MHGVIECLIVQMHDTVALVAAITPKFSREKSCAAGETALQLSTGPTWYETFYKNTHLHSRCLFYIMHYLLFAGPFVAHPRPQHQTSSDKTSKKRRRW